jgi:hypothetical protein
VGQAIDAHGFRSESCAIGGLEGLQVFSPADRSDLVDIAAVFVSRDLGKMAAIQ